MVGGCILQININLFSFSGTFYLQLYPHERYTDGAGAMQFKAPHPGAVPAEPEGSYISLFRVSAVDGAVPRVAEYLLHVHRIIHGPPDCSHRMGVHYAFQSNHRSITTPGATCKYPIHLHMHLGTRLLLLGRVPVDCHPFCISSSLRPPNA